MRRLLNTLYVTTQGAYLRKEGETVVVEVEKEIRLRLPLLNLGGIVYNPKVVPPDQAPKTWEDLLNPK